MPGPPNSPSPRNQNGSRPPLPSQGGRQNGMNALGQLVAGANVAKVTPGGIAAGLAVGAAGGMMNKFKSRKQKKHDPLRVGKADKQVANILLLLAFLLSVADIVTSFVGLNWNRFLMELTPDNLIAYITSSLFTIFLIYYVVSKIISGKHSPAEILSFLLALLFITIIFMNSGGAPMVYFHFLFAAIVYFYLFKRDLSDDPVRANTLLLLVLFLDFFLLSFLEYHFSFSLSRYAFILPIWFIFLLIYNNGLHSTTLSRVLLIIIIAFYFFAFIVTQIDMNDLTQKADPSANPELVVSVNTAWENGKAWWDDLKTNIKKGYNDTLNRATSDDYYRGQVDSKAKIPLGVKVKSFEPTFDTYYAGDSVILSAIITADTFDSPMDLTFSCYTYGPNTARLSKSALEDKPRFYGTVKPDTSAQGLRIYESDEIYASCEFDDLEEGSYQFFFETTFTFNTQAYQRNYFVNLDTKRAFQERDEDLLASYGIRNAKATTIHTNGPVEIGMIENTQPIGVSLLSSENERQPNRIGVTVTNLWDGEIKELTGLTLKLPPGLSTTADDCSANFVQTLCDQQSGICQGDQYDLVYSLDSSTRRRPGIGHPSLSHIDDAVTFSCRYTVDDPQAILGDGPYAVQFIKADVSYQYLIEDSARVTVKKNTLAQEGEDAGTLGQTTGGETSVS